MLFDFTRVVGFQWDVGNERKNLDKHDVAQSEAEQAFLNEPLLVSSDRKHSDHEPRFHALGRTDAGRTLHLTFTVREDGSRLRIISARNMSRRERDIYARS